MLLGDRQACGAIGPRDVGAGRLAAATVASASPTIWPQTTIAVTNVGGKSMLHSVKIYDMRAKPLLLGRERVQGAQGDASGAPNP